MSSLDEIGSAFDETDVIIPKDDCNDCGHHHHKHSSGHKSVTGKFDLRKTSDKIKNQIRWGIRLY